MTRASVPSRPAFTMLELLLAVTLIASMSVLIGLLLAQSREWAEDADDGGAAMRATRVMEALREQWGDRRTAVGLDDEGASAVLAPDSLRFVTARPLLFPDWPLASAEYRIEEDFDSEKGNGRLWKLTYVESRITRMKAVADDTENLDGRPRTDRVTLLTACESLVWERRAAARVPNAEVPPDSEEADGVPEARATVEATVPGEVPTIDWQPPKGTSKDLSLVRLMGRKKGESFSCVLVAKASR